MIKNINDGTYSQSSGTYKDHGPWVPGTYRAVNNFESLLINHWLNPKNTITCIMPLFHWPAMPRRSYGVRKNEQIRSKIAEMVWWNISGVTISYVLRINYVSMAHGWRTCGAYGVWMAMPLRMMPYFPSCHISQEYNMFHIEKQI